MILILTHQQGFETDFVIDHLNEKNIKFFRFNADFDVNGTEINIIEKFDKFEVTLKCDNKKINTSNVSVAWLQQLPPRVEQRSEFDRYTWLKFKSFKSAYDFACNGIRASWINSPKNIAYAENKLNQLEAAKKIGLEIPETIVTNNPKHIKDFYNKHSQKIIFKNISTAWYIDENDNTLAASTKLFTKDILGYPKSIESLPLIYQKYIDRVLDIRVVVVGEKIFSAAIESNDPNAKYDIRQIPVKNSIYKTYSLPAEIEKKLLLLLKKFNLQYVSADFVLSNDSTYYFLELNCTGAFVWLERIANLPISKEIADFLISKIK